MSIDQCRPTVLRVAAPLRLQERAMPSHGAMPVAAGGSHRRTKMWQTSRRNIRGMALVDGRLRAFSGRIKQGDKTGRNGSCMNL